jgi:lipooligosaccharide transport system permease protein
VVVDSETWGLARAQGAQSPPTVRVLRYYAHAYRRTWRSSVTVSFLYPVFYLTAMGVGLGSLINHHTHLVDHVQYLDFIAPGLLAATAMQIAANDSMWPVMAAIKWIRTYFAMLATPLTVTDILLGHLLWITLRLVMVATIYLGVMAAFGVVASPLAIAALPAAVLIGLAFAAPLSAFAATQENDHGFPLVYRMMLIPLFLFSGTFFPVGQLPGWLQVVAACTPLYHGVHLARALVLGQAQLSGVLGDVAYLVGLAVLGTLLARLTYGRRLVI